MSVNHKNASKGTTITITVEPDKDYELDTLTVVDKDGNNNAVTAKGNGKYTFTMSASKVTIEAHFVSANWNLCYRDCSGDEACPIYLYTDVKATDWYHDGMHFCLENGLMLGYGNGKFGPHDALTREQMVVMLWRYAQHKGYDVSVGENTNILSCDDATTVAEYTIPAMQWACGSGMVVGENVVDGGVILDPKSNTTCAQMATMMMRFCT